MKLIAFWFKDKELALAFGIILAFSRMGSVLNFLCTESFNEAFHLQWTLWGGKTCVILLIKPDISFFYFGVCKRFLFDFLKLC